MRLLCLKSRQDLMTTDTGDEKKKKPTYRYGRFNLRHDLSPAADCVGFFSRHKAFVTLCPAVQYLAPVSLARTRWGTVGVQNLLPHRKSSCFPTFLKLGLWDDVTIFLHHLQHRNSLSRHKLLLVLQVLSI